jgi:hypothetical protein
MWPFKKKKEAEEAPLPFPNVGRVYAVATLDDGEHVCFERTGTAWYDIDGNVQIKKAELILHEVLVRATERGFLPVFAHMQMENERAGRWIPVSRIKEITSTQVEWETTPG